MPDTPPPEPAPVPDDDLLAALRELSSLDLEAADVHVAGAAQRPVLDDVDAVEREQDTVVVVTLSFAGRRVVGTRRGGHAPTQVDRAAAEATLAALAELVPPNRVEWHVDRTELLDPPTAHRPGVAHVAVAVRTARGEEILVGAAIVRSDSHDAAARATLDAVNRRVEQLTADQ